MKRTLGCTVALAVLAGSVLPALAATEEPTSPVREVLDVPYYTGPGADEDRHRLDLYLPGGKKGFPIAVFVHGGGWMLGDKGFFGHGQALGRHFARLGVGVVMPSYRLSPRVKHPEHIRDVARAVAWTVKNLGAYGGDINRLYLVGHSAGGHLVSLLATDKTYLKAVGIKPSLIRGVVSISGVYRAPELAFNFGVAGASEGLKLTIHPFSVVFGTDPGVDRKAFPLHHVTAGLPPFLLVNAERDLPTLPEMTTEFAAALKRAGDKVQVLRVPGRDHDSVLFRAVTDKDPVSRAVAGFILGGS
jgi:acetyl esterase/lipase